MRNIEDQITAQNRKTNLYQQIYILEKVKSFSTYSITTFLSLITSSPSIPFSKEIYCASFT